MEWVEERSPSSRRRCPPQNDNDLGGWCGRLVGSAVRAGGCGGGGGSCGSRWGCVVMAPPEERLVAGGSLGGSVLVMLFVMGGLCFRVFAGA